MSKKAYSVAINFFRVLLGVGAVYLAYISLGTALYFEYRNPYDFKIEVRDVFNLIELREQITDLKILYQDEDILESKKEIKVIRIQISNDGDAILQGYYDKMELFGLKFQNSHILMTEVLDSNSDYLKKNFIDSYRDNIDASHEDIIFSKVIFDKGDFITLKATILLNENDKLEIIPIGKIANIDNLKVDYYNNSTVKKSLVIIKYSPLIFLVFVLLIFFMSVTIIFLDRRHRRRRIKNIKRYIDKNADLKGSQDSIVDYYVNMPRQIERLIKVLLKNNNALDLKQVMEAQFRIHIFFIKLFGVLTINKISETRFQELNKDIFYTDGALVSFNKDNENFVRSFFNSVLIDA